MNIVESTLKRFAPKGPRFSDIIVPDAVGSVSLDAIALVILRSLAAGPKGAALMRDSAIQTFAGSYPREMRVRARERIAEAWQVLLTRGHIAPTTMMGTFESWFVTDAGRVALTTGEISFGRADLLPKAMLNAVLAEKVTPLYFAGRYDDACTAAFKQLEIAVRRLGGFGEDLNPRQLMMEAFKPNEGPLSDIDAREAEQVGARELMTGAMSYFRNPLTHRDVGISQAVSAASMILFANELMAIAMSHAIAREQNRIVDERDAADNAAIEQHRAAEEAS